MKIRVSDILTNKRFHVCQGFVYFFIYSTLFKSSNKCGCQPQRDTLVLSLAMTIMKGKIVGENICSHLKVTKEELITSFLSNSRKQGLNQEESTVRDVLSQDGCM
jgi:hypothetical protein